ncbi:YihY/virulence factor BrkB family protein [Streptomyces sp. NBC_01317]|uniref:YihY/virulence factor BrkB family protein n=1 Tax=Streptomyces sp. NBC_01317 TaxID=2903822 RepID=UPI002E124871|nr:YihY/virulence factor BrkB family protein [Streptomyces sp. NBC_01317]
MSAEESAPTARRFGRALRRTPLAMWHDDATDVAAALTYYAVLAIFPALLVTVCSIGLAGPDAGGTLAAQVTALVPAQSRVLVSDALREMAGQRSAAWLLASFGTVGALWSASSYLGVFRRALHAMHGAVDHRPPWRTAPRIALTACALLALLVTSAFSLVLTGEAAAALGRILGMKGAVDAVWGGLKWPLLLALAAVLVLLVFRTGPPGTRRLRRALPGGILAVVLWLLTSAGFALYTAHAGTYNRLYGSLAGVIVFLVWLWVTNLSLLAGAQFNAELARGSAGPRAKAGPTTSSSDRPGSPGADTRPALSGVQQLRLDPAVVPRMPTKRW